MRTLGVRDLLAWWANENDWSQCRWGCPAGSAVAEHKLRDEMRYPSVPDCVRRSPTNDSCSSASETTLSTTAPTCPLSCRCVRARPLMAQSRMGLRQSLACAMDRRSPLLEMGGTSAPGAAEAGGIFGESTRNRNAQDGAHQECSWPERY